MWWDNACTETERSVKCHCWIQYCMRWDQHPQTRVTHTMTTWGDMRNDLSLASFLLFQQSIFNRCRRCLGSLVSLAIFAPWHMAVHAIHPSQTFTGCHPLSQVSPPSTKSRSTSSNNSSSPKGALFVKSLRTLTSPKFAKLPKQNMFRVSSSLKIRTVSLSHCQSLSFHGGFRITFSRLTAFWISAKRRPQRSQGQRWWGKWIVRYRIVSYDIVNKWVPFSDSLLGQHSFQQDASGEDNSHGLECESFQMKVKISINPSFFYLFLLDINCKMSKMH